MNVKSLIIDALIIIGAAVVVLFIWHKVLGK